MDKTWNKMLPVKNRGEIYIFTVYVVVPKPEKNYGGRVTQTSVVAIIHIRLNIFLIQIINNKTN